MAILFAWRTGKGYSQDRVAELAGVSRQTVVNLENGDGCSTLTAVRLHLLSDRALPILALLVPNLDDMLIEQAPKMKDISVAVDALKKAKAR